jgi:hypothetical protein
MEPDYFVSWQNTVELGVRPENFTASAIIIFQQIAFYSLYVLESGTTAMNYCQEDLHGFKEHPNHHP